MIKNLLFILIALLCFSSCEKQNEKQEKGVSLTLAKHRKETIHNVHYNLFFDIPEKFISSVRGEVNISFDSDLKQEIVFDFKSNMREINKSIVNGDYCEITVLDEHIIIPKDKILKGKNDITFYFDAPNTSLNRREDFMYTLLVPDRARTLFPCFDQPNIKAKFTLKLAVPKAWTAVANSGIVSVDTLETDNVCMYNFSTTHPISTYLFSFVAGKFDAKQYSQNGRVINIYHKQNDAKKLKQLDDIASEVYNAIDWLEKYTKIDYPFEKYDLVIVPGFQFGGMEHMGATLYKEATMFLPDDASITRKMSRSSLIAHETSHMWFGDFVTMDWFNDVWNKEVFANYYADEIIKEMYLEVDNRQNFMKYFVAAYSEDRTQGSNPLTQDLDNLENAGLVYGNIIYNKAPIVMRMLVEMIGKENFDEGIRDYLNKYAYGNASWDNLISTLDSHTHIDLKSWSRVWVNTKGMPTIETAINNDSLFLVQHDPFERGVLWSEKITFLAVGDDFQTPVSVDMHNAAHSIALPKNTKFIVPNSDMMAYGFFALDSLNMRYSVDSLSVFSDAIIKNSILTNLHENLLNNYISPKAYSQALLNYIPTEKNQLLYSKAMSNLYYCFTKCDLARKDATKIERFYWNIAKNDENPVYRKDALGKLISGAKNNSTKAKLLNIYKGKDDLKVVDEDMRISLSLMLSIYFPELSEEIISETRKTIKNKFKLEEFEFVSQAVVGDTVSKNGFFRELLKEENRQIEPWASRALSLLNNSNRQQDAIIYIRPALDILPEIQKTGDIFFPQSWVSALLGGHSSKEARDIVQKYIDDNKNVIQPMLMGKVKQKSYDLFRR